MKQIPFRQRPAMLLSLCTALLLPVSAPAENRIEHENARPGTTGWQILPANAAANQEIEGYASRTSINAGEKIQFYVNVRNPTRDRTYGLQIFRMGWYGDANGYNGKGGRLVHGPVTLTSVRQSIPTPDPRTGMIECDWDMAYELTVPANQGTDADWVSGVYLALLTGSSSRKQSYIPFVVRDDASESDYLFQCSVMTYQAYNNWGDKSLYGFNSAGYVPARKVSFNRPYNYFDGLTVGYGAGQFLKWEYQMVRFLEREGYDVTYCTSNDVDADDQLLLPHMGFLSVGHDEYWTWEMRQNVERALHDPDVPVHLGFFGANGCYWQVRLETSPLTGAPDRTIVGYKEAAGTDDPLTDEFGKPLERFRMTTQWRMPPVNRPENGLMGVMYSFQLDEDRSGDLVVTDPNHWIYAETGLQRNDRLSLIIGYEADIRFDNGAEPLGLTTVASSTQLTDSTDGHTGYSQTAVYKTLDSNVWVFGAATLQWTWGLDDYNHQTLPDRDYEAVQQMTRNILQKFQEFGAETPKGQRKLR